MNTKTIKPPKWFWIVSVLALLWNVLGVKAYLDMAYMSDAMKSTLPADQLALIENTPAWVTAAFAIAVWGGLLGSMALLLRKKWAKSVLALSLLGIFFQMAHSFFMTNASEVYGPVQGLIIPIMVIAIGIGLLLFARLSDRKQWLS